MEENKNIIGLLYDMIFDRYDYITKEYEKEENELRKRAYKAKKEELERIIEKFDSRNFEVMDEEYKILWERFSRLVKSYRREKNKERQILYLARIHELNDIMNMMESIIYGIKEEEV